MKFIFQVTTNSNSPYLAPPDSDSLPLFMLLLYLMHYGWYFSFILLLLQIIYPFWIDVAMCLLCVVFDWSGWAWGVILAIEGDEFKRWVKNWRWWKMIDEWFYVVLWMRVMARLVLIERVYSELENELKEKMKKVVQLYRLRFLTEIKLY